MSRSRSSRPSRSRSRPVGTCSTRTSRPTDRSITPRVQSTVHIDDAVISRAARSRRDRRVRRHGQRDPGRDLGSPARGDRRHEDPRGHGDGRQERVPNPPLQVDRTQRRAPGAARRRSAGRGIGQARSSRRVAKHAGGATWYDVYVTRHGASRTNETAPRPPRSPASRPGPRNLVRADHRAAGADLGRGAVHHRAAREEHDEDLARGPQARGRWPARRLERDGTQLRDRRRRLRRRAGRRSGSRTDHEHRDRRRWLARRRVPSGCSSTA